MGKKEDCSMKDRARLLGAIFVTFLFLALSGCESGTSEKAYDAPEGLAGGISHSVSGALEQIDPDKRVLTVKTEHGALRLPFDAAIADLRPGDTITAWLTLEGAEEPAARAYDAPQQKPLLGGPPPAGESHIDQHLMGTVQDIDHDKGMFNLQAEGAMLTLYFPPQEIEDLQNGDRVVLYSSLSSAAEED
jgi:hypothetical protein